MTRVSTLLQEGVAGADAKLQGTCRNLLKLEAALWTFVWETGVDPTNNCAERPLRRAVLWRRRSFGTQSAAGSQFVERILTAVTTLRQQRRDVLDYLTAACAATIRREPAPSLLPLTSPPLTAR
jgi:transposase